MNKFIPVLELDDYVDLKIGEQETLRFVHNYTKTDCLVTPIQLLKFLKENCPIAWKEVTKDDLQKARDSGWEDDFDNCQDNHDYNNL